MGTTLSRSELRRQSRRKPAGNSSQKPDEPSKAPPQRSGDVPLADLPKHLAEYVVKEASVKAEQMSLATGQRLTLVVRAADLCTFGNGPNIGSGESWQLDVVTQDELVTRLEAQELLVKQRFEAIVEEMTETRNLLLKMDFTPPEKAGTVGPEGQVGGRRARRASRRNAQVLRRRTEQATFGTDLASVTKLSKKRRGNGGCGCRNRGDPVTIR